MNATSILLAPMPPSARSAIVGGAKTQAPQAALADVPDVETALRRPASEGPEVLFLFEPGAAALAAAQAAADSSGAHRWAVIVVGAAGAATASVLLPPEDWDPARAGRAIRTALRIHEADRDNSRLRGDLSTLGRRISHDLRAPLSGIYSACDAINEMSGSTGDVRVFTQTITSSADELVELIERVSFLLKTSAEPAQKEPALVGEIVFGTLQRLEKIILKTGAVVSQPTQWPVVSALPAALEIIWTDLLRNALQHGGPKPRVELGWSETPVEFRFWVDDHGPGVPADRTGRLFQRFNLLHRLNATRGLGLSVVQRLAELQGGHTGYEPRAGGGARFYFTLPNAGTHHPA
ncbi:MAG: hypothetical protein JWM88_1680 [Verrucomicrobia bacterium]|nr:hypothetical protein [Verrucomicrobiota bacterium]